MKVTPNNSGEGGRYGQYKYPKFRSKKFLSLIRHSITFEYKTAIQSPENLKKFMISFKKEKYPNEDTMKCKMV